MLVRMKRTNVWVFLVIALGGAWLVNIPTWLSGEGQKYQWFAVAAAVMMFAPSLAVLVVWLLGRRHGVTVKDLGRDTGLGLGPRKRRTFAAAGALWLGVPLFVAATTLLSAAFGLYKLDIGGFSLFAELARDMPGGDSMPPRTLAIITLASIPVMVLLNLIPCFGEEWGWRGYLMPRLLGHGTFRAVLVSGVIWGLWHAPLTLLGYNYANLGPWAALLFVPFCVLYGAVLSWTRLATGSVWPAVVGHSALNSSVTLVVLLGAAGQQPNMVLVGPISVVGMAVLALVVAALFGLRRRASRTPVVRADDNVTLNPAA